MCINFTFDKSVINPDYLQNRAAIRTLTELATDPRVYIDSIVLKPLASPEGNYEHNIALANARGQAVLELIRDLNPELEARIGVLEGAEAWEELRECIVTDPWMSPRAKRRVLYQVYEDPRVAGKPVEMKWAIEHNLGNDTSLNNPANPTGNIWWYLYHRYYWRIRRSCICLLNIYIDVPEETEAAISQEAANQEALKEIVFGVVEADSAEQGADDTPVQQDTMVVAIQEVQAAEETQTAEEAQAAEEMQTAAAEEKQQPVEATEDATEEQQPEGAIEEAQDEIEKEVEEAEEAVEVDTIQVDTTAVKDSLLNYPIVQDAVLADSVATEEPVADTVAEPTPTEEPANIAPVAAPGKGSRQATEQPEEAAEEEQQPEEAAEDVAEEQQPEETTEEKPEDTTEEQPAEEQPSEEQPAEEQSTEESSEEEQQPEEATEEQPEEPAEEQPAEDATDEEEPATNEEVAEETPATNNPSTISWNDIKNDIPKRPVTNDRARAWLDRDYEKPIPIVIPVPTPESSIL